MKMGPNILVLKFSLKYHPKATNVRVMCVKWVSKTPIYHLFNCPNNMYNSSSMIFVTLKLKFSPKCVDKNKCI